MQLEILPAGEWKHWLIIVHKEHSVFDKYILLHAAITVRLRALKFIAWAGHRCHYCVEGTNRIHQDNDKAMGGTYKFQCSNKLHNDGDNAVVNIFLLIRSNSVVS